MRVILASASPRRLELLRTAGVEPEVRPVALDETPLPDEAPDAMVRRLARQKADLAARGLTAAGAGPDDRTIVLAADTTVAVDGRILGKPADASDAARMLRLLSGRDHVVLTAMAMTLLDAGRASSAGSGQASRAAPRADDVCESRVVFAPLSDAEIEAYVASGEPLDKAGAYAIQAGAGRFVLRVEGSYSNVVGLPLERLEPLLARLGLSLDDLRAR